MAFNLNKKDIRNAARVVGWTIRWNSEWQEFQAFPMGTNMAVHNAYFTTDGEDALGTVLDMVKGEKHGTPREFTTTEQLDIETSGTHWFNEETHADHPIGDRLEAVGDNVYRVHYNVNEGAEIEYRYFYSLEDALKS